MNKNFVEKQGKKILENLDVEGMLLLKEVLMYWGEWAFVLR